MFDKKTSFITFVSSLLLLSSGVQGQRNERAAPVVTNAYDVPLYKETFDSISGLWPIISNSENLLIIQDGEYILNRKSRVSPFAAMCDYDSVFGGFRLLTSLMLVKTASSEGSMGCIFLAPQGGSGGYIFEFNLSQKYRLREISSNGYRILSGSEKDGGWVRSNLIQPEGTYNQVEIRTSGADLDIYINKSILLNYSGLSYSSGSFGFIISPGSIGKVDFVEINVDSAGLNGMEAADRDQLTDDREDIATLAGSIAEYKSQLNALMQKNEELELRISTFREAEEEQQRMKIAYESRIANLEAQMQKRQKSIDSLQLVNQDLNKYKDMVKGNEGGDVVISLSRNLKSEKLRVDELQKSNQALRDSISRLQIELKKRKSGSEKSNTPSKSNSFALPQEN